MGVSLGRLTRRPEFLRVAGSRRKFAAKGLVLQARRREEDDPPAAETARIGFTATRKIGGAVARNRARRRLRAAARAVMPDAAAAGWDYVLVARGETLTRPYAKLLDDLRAALAAVSRDREKHR